MKSKEQQAAEIAARYGNVEYEESDTPGLPEPGRIIPLVRIPPSAAFTETIGGTEYTVNAHFKENGRDMLYYLCRLLKSGVAPEREDL